ncbi:hypothetical protein ACWEFL_35190 [Streptomyces sp. NPDC004838]
MTRSTGQEADPGKVLFERFVDLWNGEVDFADTPGFIADDFAVHSAELARYLGLPDSNRITTRERLAHHRHDGDTPAGRCPARQPDRHRAAPGGGQE